MTSPSASDAALDAALAALTLELVEIPSVTGAEDALRAHVAARLARSLGADAVIAHPRGVVALPRPRRADRPTVGLLGHLDTVPPRQGSPPRVDAEHVRGVGASDMKAGLAVMCALAERLDFEALGVNVTFVFYDAEEGPYALSGLTPMLEDIAPLGDIDLAFCLEPSDNRLQLGAVGTLHATLTFRGRRAHSARPWQGENAVHKAGPLLAELLERPPREVRFGALSYREVMSVTMVEGTGTRNVIPDRLALNLNYRFAPGRSIAEAQAEVEALVGQRAEVTWTDLSPSGPVVPLDHPLLAPLVAAGVPVEAKQAWTDVARLGLYGVDAVNLGPGESAQAHQQDERCRRELITAGYRLFEGYLTTLAPGR